MGRSQRPCQTGGGPVGDHQRALFATQVKEEASEELTKLKQELIKQNGQNFHIERRRPEKYPAQEKAQVFLEITSCLLSFLPPPLLCLKKKEGGGSNHRRLI